jgi:hypothetical protein
MPLTILDEGDNQSKGTFLSLPRATNLDASFRFGPKRATIESHSLEVKLRVDPVFLAVDILQSLLQLYKEKLNSKFVGRDSPEVTLPLTPPTSPFIQALSVCYDISLIQLMLTVDASL